MQKKTKKIIKYRIKVRSIMETLLARKIDSIKVKKETIIKFRQAAKKKIRKILKTCTKIIKKHLK